MKHFEYSGGNDYGVTLQYTWDCYNLGTFHTDYIRGWQDHEDTTRGGFTENVGCQMMEAIIGEKIESLYKEVKSISKLSFEEIRSING